MALSALALAVFCISATAKTSIVFVSDEGKFRNIVLLDPDSGAEEILTKPPEADTRVHFNQQPAVSKDGRRLAYASYKIVPDVALAEWKNWSGQPLFPDEGFYIYGYSYYPNRRYYESIQNFNWNIHVFDIGSRKERQISALKWDEAKPMWTSRGGGVMYTIKAEKSVFVLDGKFSGKFKQITLRDNEAIDFDVSPDGRTMAYSSYRDHNWEIATLKVKESWPESTADRLTRTSKVSEIRPLWAPDGRTLLFLANRRRRDKYDLFTIDVKTKVIEQVTQSGGVGADYSWSPDGARIAYTMHDSKSGRLSIVDLVSKEVKQLTSPTADDFHPTWSPDGGTILFVRRMENGYFLFTVPADGGEAKQLSKTPCFPDPPLWFEDKWSGKAR